MSTALLHGFDGWSLDKYELVESNNDEIFTYENGSKTHTRTVNRADTTSPSPYGRSRTEMILDALFGYFVGQGSHPRPSRQA